MHILMSLLIHLLQIGLVQNPVQSTLVLMPRQTEQEEAAELAKEVYSNKTYLNIPFIGGSGADYVMHFKAAYGYLKAADPKAAKKKSKNLTPAQFKRETARTKAEAAKKSTAAGIASVNPAVPDGPQERPTAAIGLLPMLMIPDA